MISKILPGLILSFFLFACSRLITNLPAENIMNKESDLKYEYYYTEGLRKKFTGSPADAIIMFEEAAKICSEREGSYYQIAHISYSLGDLVNAIIYGKKALERKENIWTYLLLSNAYYDKGLTDSAAKVIEKAVIAYPSNDELKFFLGNIYYDSDKYEKAITVFTELDKKYGIGGNSAVPLVKSLIRIKKYNEAEFKLQKLIEFYPDVIEFKGLLAELYRDSNQEEKAAEVYNELIKENPEDIRLILSLIEFLKQNGGYQDVFNILNSVALKEAISVEDKVSVYAVMMEDTTIKNSYSREFEMTLMILETAYPGNELVMLLRPEFLGNIGRIEEAAVLLEKYVALWPKNYYAWEKLLGFSYDLGNYEKVYAFSSQAVRLFNIAPFPRLLNAYSSLNIGLFDEALEQIRKLYLLINGDEILKMQLVSLEAEAFYKKGETEKAFSKYDEALNIDPDNLVILNNYAYFLAENNMRLKEALKMIRKVVKEEKFNHTYNDTYAWVLYKTGRFGKAAEIMRQIIGNEAENDAEYYEHYGYILKARRNCREAIIMWNKALELDRSKKNLIDEIEKCKRILRS